MKPANGTQSGHKGTKVPRTCMLIRKYLLNGFHAAIFMTSTELNTEKGSSNMAPENPPEVPLGKSPIITSSITPNISPEISPETLLEIFPGLPSKNSPR